MITAKIPLFKYNEQVVLRDIAIQFAASKTHGMVGLNGAGKTTFFKLLAGFTKYETCSFLKNDLPLLHREVAFIDTDLFLYRKLTAREFLNVFPRNSPNYNEEKLAQLFRLPLDGFTEEYSTGMKKKLLLLSQIKQNKEIYILDEPFNGLDLETNKILEIMIGILNERGKTVFISSHILDPLLKVCDSIHYIKDQTIHKTYAKEEFNLIEQELFGSYSKEMRDELGGMI